jgi:hypothetical protein
MRSCLTCSGSHGRAPPCTQVNFLDILRATAAFVFRTIFLNCFSPQRPGAEPLWWVTGRRRRRIWHRIPGLMLAPKDFTSAMLRPLAEQEYDWKPERSPERPITIVVSSSDRALYMFRNGNPIGRAALEIRGRDRLGSHIFILLEGTTGKPSQLAPGREARRWMRVTSEGRPVEAEQLASQLHFSAEFGQKVADEIKPGTTVVVTDQAVVRKPKSDSTFFAFN